jgi:hypothetical protein
MFRNEKEICLGYGSCFDLKKTSVFCDEESFVAERLEERRDCVVFKAIFVQMSTLYLALNYWLEFFNGVFASTKNI